MSIRLRRTSSAVLAAALALAQGCDEAPPTPPAPSARVDPPARNPIEVALTAQPAAAERRDGTAIQVLVDSSGSMDESVADATGRQVRKIEIARRCVASLVRQAEKFAADHPLVPIVLGIADFSVRPDGPPCRNVVALGPPDEAKAARQLAHVKPNGGTPIGDAVIEAKLQLDRHGFRRNHIVVITDGQNTNGYAPADVVNVISRLPEERRASVYFVAFDVAAEHFSAARDAGALVLGAANERELQQTLDYVLTGKILAEQTGPEPKK